MQCGPAGTDPAIQLVGGLIAALRIGLDSVAYRRIAHITQQAAGFCGDASQNSGV